MIAQELMDKLPVTVTIDISVPRMPAEFLTPIFAYQQRLPPYE